MNLPTLSPNFRLMLFLPTRLVTIFTMLTLIPIFNVSWEVATGIFQAFFPVYVASFVIEGMLSEGGLKKNFQSLSTKYVIEVPVEFAGVASFALLTFSTKPDEAFMMGVYISAVVVACTIFVELYHRYLTPRLSKIILSEKQSILLVIPFVMFIVIYGTYSLISYPIFG